MATQALDRSHGPIITASECQRESPEAGGYDLIAPQLDIMCISVTRQTLSKCLLGLRHNFTCIRVQECC